MKLAMVTGATGFVGSHLVRRLLSDGVAVRALARPGSPRSSLQGLEVEVVEGDLLDGAVVRNALRGCDACFHLAAAYSVPDPADLYRVNVDGTRVVLEAAGEVGVPAVVHAGTVGTLGRADGRPATETDHWLPPEASHYVRSKFQADLLARSFAPKGLPVSIAHLGAPVGAWDRVPTVTGRRILAVLSGSMPAYSPGAIHHVPARDVAAGLALVATRGRAGASYILGHVLGNLTRAEFVRLVCRAGGVPAPRPSRLRAALRWLRGKGRRSAPGVPRSLACDPRWSVEALGLPQTPLEVAFAEAVDWFREQGRC